MEDITLRALRTLGAVDLIAAEDTRHTRKLLSRYDISTPLVSYHEHNTEKRTPELLRKLEEGNTIALVTDAGTPSVSDPGYDLVKNAIERAMPVVPIPGPCAVITALSVSGLPSDGFVFIGFVPRKAGKRKAFLDNLKRERRTLVFYESPKRLLGLFQIMGDVFGNRRAVLARELTKVHEEILRDTLDNLLDTLAQRSSLKGECTVLVEGCLEETRDVDLASVREHLRRLGSHKRVCLSKLAKDVAGEYGLSKKIVYEEALRLKKEDTKKNGT
jgi:16S rRNA (cytidine1402-2'-O)-methyltransferase